jgi:predicted nucleic acid-binding protein
LPRKRSRRKRRVVVDTNVLVAGVAGLRQPYAVGRNPSADLLYRWSAAESFVWLYSEEIIAEYKAVMERLHVRPRTIGTVMNLIREQAEEIAPGRSARVSPDPNDDPFCACAQAGRADFILTAQPKGFPSGAPDSKGHPAR